MDKTTGLSTFLHCCRALNGLLSVPSFSEYVKSRNAEHGADPGTWAMLGAAAFWSGSGRVTVTIAVIMLEITG